MRPGYRNTAVPDPASYLLPYHSCFCLNGYFYGLNTDGMIRKIGDFLESWKYETEMTLKLFSLIQEHRFHEQPHPDVRTAARLGWHITHTIGEMLSHTGIKLEGYTEEQELYWTKKELIDAYTHFAKKCAEEIQRSWK